MSNPQSDSDSRKKWKILLHYVKWVWKLLTLANTSNVHKMSLGSRKLSVSSLLVAAEQVMTLSSEEGLFFVSVILIPAHPVLPETEITKMAKTKVFPFGFGDKFIKVNLIFTFLFNWQQNLYIVDKHNCFFPIFIWVFHKILELLSFISPDIYFKIKLEWRSYTPVVYLKD